MWTSKSSHPPTKPYRVHVLEPCPAVQFAFDVLATLGVSLDAGVRPPETEKAGFPLAQWQMWWTRLMGAAVSATDPMLSEFRRDAGQRTLDDPGAAWDWKGERQMQEIIKRLPLRSPTEMPVLDIPAAGREQLTTALRGKLCYGQALIVVPVAWPNARLMPRLGFGVVVATAHHTWRGPLDELAEALMHATEFHTSEAP